MKHIVKQITDIKSKSINEAVIMWNYKQDIK